MMSNNEWMTLVAKEFNVSNTVAKKMVHAMMDVYRVHKTVQDRIAVDNNSKQNQNKPWTDLVIELAAVENRA